MNVRTPHHWIAHVLLFKPTFAFALYVCFSVCFCRYFIHCSLCVNCN